MIWTPQIGQTVIVTEVSSEFSHFTPGDILTVNHVEEYGFTAGGIYFYIDNKFNDQTKYTTLSVDRNRKMKEILR